MVLNFLHENFRANNNNTNNNNNDDDDNDNNIKTIYQNGEVEREKERETEREIEREEKKKSVGRLNYVKKFTRNTLTATH